MYINSFFLYIFIMVIAWFMLIFGFGFGISITLLGVLLDCFLIFIFCWKYNDYIIWGFLLLEVEFKYKKILYIFFMVIFYRKVKIIN